MSQWLVCGLPGGLFAKLSGNHSNLNPFHTCSCVYPNFVSSKQTKKHHQHSKKKLNIQMIRTVSLHDLLVFIDPLTNRIGMTWELPKPCFTVG